MDQAMETETRCHGRRRWLIGIVFFICVEILARYPAAELQPRQNIWLTIANETGQSSFCLSVARPEDPFKTCLIGVPVFHAQSFKGFVKNVTLTSMTLEMAKRNKPANVRNFTAWWQGALIMSLNKVMPEPQELDILGSMPPANGAIVFEDLSQKSKRPGPSQIQPHAEHLVSPRNSIYKGTGDQDYASLQSRYKIHGNNWASFRLPNATFLICGDRAWPGIPSHPVGGPCYIGKLTMLKPSIAELMNETVWDYAKSHKKVKRSTLPLGPNCDDNVRFWDKPTNIIAALFAPVGAAKALQLTKTLGCWTAKHMNATSKIIHDLTTDVDDVRHAVLQNRATIDFLLLVHGHGCQEFEGMCCMNLSDHSASIYAGLRQLREHMSKMTVTTSAFDDWIKKLGFGGWLFDFLKEGFTIVVVIIVILLLLPCVVQCIRKSVQQVWVAQNRNGGCVEDFLAQNGHLNNPDL